MAESGDRIPAPFCPWQEAQRAANTSAPFFGSAALSGSCRFRPSSPATWWPTGTFCDSHFIYDTMATISFEPNGIAVPLCGRSMQLLTRSERVRMAFSRPRYWG